MAIKANAKDEECIAREGNSVVTLEDVKKRARLPLYLAHHTLIFSAELIAWRTRRRGNIRVFVLMNDLMSVFPEPWLKKAARHHGAGFIHISIAYLLINIFIGQSEAQKKTGCARVPANGV
jgi:hypothetical protein